MKKLIFCLAAVLTSVGFTACDDVPAPYGINNGDTPDTPNNPTEPQGDGTLENPYNVLDVLAYVNSLSADVSSENDVYIKGKVATITEAYGTQYGNATFSISDDGTTSNTFMVYRALYLGNKKFTEGKTAINVGDEVIICGKVVNYKGNTPETVQGQAYLYSLNGKTEDDPNSGGGSTGEVSENILSNSSFEEWNNGLPVAWKSTTTASNATLSQSTDSHNGAYAVLVAGVASQNKRLASKEYTLSAGTYTMKCYVKGAGQVCPGYVPVTDGKVGNYVYGSYVTTTDEWTEVANEITLTEETTVNFVLMNPKTSSYATASDKLVDDFTVVKTK